MYIREYGFEFFRRFNFMPKAIMCFYYTVVIYRMNILIYVFLFLFIELYTVFSLCSYETLCLDLT